MKNAHANRRGNSGQMLVITSLVVVLLLISTVAYETDIEKNALVYRSDVNLDLAAIKQAALNTVTSALVNVSNGGSPGILAEDLTRLKSSVDRSSFSGIADLEFASADSLTYAGGFHVSWGTSGEGASSAAVNFALNSSGLSASYYSEYSVNVTSTISFVGSCILLNDSAKQVELSCTVRNEGQPAKAGALEVNYQQDTDLWVSAEPSSLFDYGNGTSLMSFTACNSTLPLLSVSVHCLDARGVSVWVNATCGLR
jgi:hypothetical protein